MRRLYRGHLTTAVFATAVSVCLLFYSVLEIWNNAHSGRAGLCGWWLCPDEFTGLPIFAWHPEADAHELANQLGQYTRGVQLDPASAYRWADLGERMLAAHDEERARYCFEQAVKEGPRSPAVLYRAANFFFSTGDYRRAMRDLYLILDDSDLYMYQKAAYTMYARMGLPVSELLEGGIPPSVYAAGGYLHFLMSERQADDAREVWDWMAKRSLTDPKTTVEYISFLLQNGQALGAAEDWGARNWKLEPAYRQTDWVYNGSFERTPSPVALDWHIEEIKDVRVNRTQSVAKDGQWSLELTFDGRENVDYHHTYEQTVVGAGRWRLSALIKTQSVSTDQGVSLHVFDVEDRARLDVRTDAVQGTHDWFTVEKEFEISQGTSLVQMEIARIPSEQFDNKIEGRAWVDAVELSPVR